ncbi:MAG: transcriptional regulator [Phycisphaerales bacterium]|nr:transcriptional regulator [Phycisphaerales bacterium]
MADPKKQIISLARKRGVLRARDLEPFGIARRVLSEMTEKGMLLRTGRGLYVLAGAEASEHHSLAEAQARVPAGVVCLLSALRFHGLTTQNPWEVWMAVTPASRRPKVDNPPLRIVRFSGKPFTDGIEHHPIDGVPVRVYSPAKTVADCFRYRNKIGIDVAIEALRDVWRRKRATADEISHFAAVCRVTNVMRPYVESLLA